MPPLYPPYLCSSETQSLSVLPEDLGTYDRVAVLMENATVPDSLRVALTTALTSMQSNPNGWNTVLQPTVTAESVALVTNSTIRISLGAVSCILSLLLDLRLPWTSHWVIFLVMKKPKCLAS